MMQTMTRDIECSAGPVHLLVAFELGQEWWKVGFTTGWEQCPRIRRIAAGDVPALQTEIARAKAAFRLPAETAVISCYEAGRDGFWLHRYLGAHAVTNYVVDSASIEVNRRARRSKTDQLDLRGLLNLLARYVAGDRRCWRVVRVPSVADEDARQLHRTLETLQADRTRMRNRLKAVLATVGVRLAITADFLAQLEAARLWMGRRFPLARGIAWNATGANCRRSTPSSRRGAPCARRCRSTSQRRRAGMSPPCRHCAPSALPAGGCWRPRSLAGGRSGMPANSAP